MPAYFVDSSALVKRYVPEVGSAWLKGICDPSSGSTVDVSAVTGVEVVAALARRGRGGGLTASDVTNAIAQLHIDAAAEYRTVALRPEVLARAAALAEKHALRGYDAVQLASALAACDARLRLGLPSLTVVSADGELNAAAVGEGLTVDDPNSHP